MIHIPELDALTNEFAQCAYEPLRVTVQLEPNGRIVNYDPLNLDGLLARAVVSMATEGRLLADTEDGYWIPLPLKVLAFVNKFPLWAASVLYPAGDYVDDIYIRHKRNSGGYLHNKPKLKTRAGPWMSRRMPTPVRVCSEYEARCIGNLEAIQNLLGSYTHIGKLRLGRVKGMRVEPAEFEEQDIWLDGDKFIKAIPANANLLNPWPETPSIVGWTPPHWKPSLFAPGFRVGTRLPEEIDFFEAVP